MSACAVLNCTEPAVVALKTKEPSGQYVLVLGTRVLQHEFCLTHAQEYRLLGYEDVK